MRHHALKRHFKIKRTAKEHIGIKTIFFWPFHILFECLNEIDENMAYQNVITLKINIRINIRINPIGWFPFVYFYLPLDSLWFAFSQLSQPLRSMCALWFSTDCQLTLRYNSRLSFYGIINDSSFQNQSISLNFSEITKRIITWSTGHWNNIRADLF